jgi:hypothetical protein
MTSARGSANEKAAQPVHQGSQTDQPIDAERAPALGRDHEGVLTDDVGPG